MYTIDEVSKASEVIAVLMQHKEFTSHTHPALFRDYSTNTGIIRIVDTILSKLDLVLIQHGNELYITPGTQNAIFGYKNQELKDLLGYTHNWQLYLSEFVMYTIILLFYKKSTYSTPKEYTTSTEVLAKATAFINTFASDPQAIVSEEDQDESCTTYGGMTEENIEEERKSNVFIEIQKEWCKLPEFTPALTETSIETIKKPNCQYGYVNKALDFFVKQGLLTQSASNYYVTPRFKALVYNYFSSKEVKNKLLDFAEAYMRRVMEQG